MHVRALNSAEHGDVETYKTVRLLALRTNPEAFGSTYAREAAFDDAIFRARLAGFHGRPGTAFLATDDLGPAGIAGIGFDDPEEHGGVSPAYLWGMWVDPRARGTGVSRALVAACIDWAERSAADRIVLDVVRANTVASSLYARFGFVPTGRTGLLPSDPCAEELEMHLVLTGRR